MSGWGHACCPSCGSGTPLISTMAFPGAEFYCLDCGDRFGFLSPISGGDGPEIIAKMAEYQKEWDENVGEKLITPRSWYSAEICDKCSMETPHEQHATEEEWAADREAREWLKNRVKVAA